MSQSIAPAGLHDRIVTGAALVGLFFGLMPPYVLMIVVVATWGVPPMEPPDEQTFRSVYFVRMALGTVLSLTVGAFLAAGATHIGLKSAGKATWLRGALGGAILGAPVGALSAGVGPLVLLISSSSPDWAWIMIQRGFLVGGLMGVTNGLVAGLVIVFFVRRHVRHADAKRSEPSDESAAVSS